MRLVTWNVNSIKVRIGQVLELAKKLRPDVICLQELKVTDEEFPVNEVEAHGYRAMVAGQRAYNGVAILTRGAFRDPVVGFADGKKDDPERRLVRLTFQGVRVASLYVPNGQAVGTDLYDHKLRWMARLRAMLEEQESVRKPLVLAGDFNVAPEPIDVYDPVQWEGRILFSEPERAAFERLKEWGLSDCLRAVHSEGGIYSWWDYRQGMFRRNKGLRIDHVLATPPLARRLVACEVAKEFRGLERPSDHAPVMADFE